MEFIIKALIAEIGNMHLGSVHKAIELIDAAKDCGATHVKMQAIGPRKPMGGSMPKGFYSQCSMSLREYCACVEYGYEKGIPVFFSVFEKSHRRIFELYPEMIKKISGSQFINQEYTEFDNDENTIISIPRFIDDVKKPVNNMQIMYVTPYNYVYSDLSMIGIFKTIFRKDIGYSDHSIGIDNCKRAIDIYGSKLIEKHFYLGSDIHFDNILYRDCKHSANPKEFKELANYYHERVNL